jgi:glutamate--cysteine ligase catalytic subunit
MLESTPSQPYGGTIRDFLKVEANMALRRQQAAEALAEDESFVTVTTYPRSGKEMDGA